MLRDWPGGFNKKVLLFIDEYGTTGVGAVVVLARDAGRMDKCLSDLLEPQASEIHASRLDDSYLQGLMQRFWTVGPRDRIVLVNQKVAARGGAAPVLYAAAAVETVKAGLARFKRDVLGHETIGNVDVITDVNHHNEPPAFEAEIERARHEGGRCRGVNRVMRLDSAALRLLQRADVVAYSRKWIVGAEVNAACLHERFVSSDIGDWIPGDTSAALKRREPPGQGGSRKRAGEGGRQAGLSASGWPRRPPDTRPGGSHAKPL